MTGREQRGSAVAWCLFGAIVLSGAPALAASEPESTLNKCQQTSGKEVGKYAAAVQKTVAKCVNKVAAEKIKDAETTAEGAAGACVSALRKLYNTEDPGKQLKDKAKAKIAVICDPAAVESKAAHSSQDVVYTSGPATVGGETIQAERLGIPCLLAGAGGSGANGQLGTIEEWIDCQLDEAERGALRQVHVEYPRADAWMREVKPAIQTMASAGDVKAQDALVALAHARRWVDQVFTVYDRLTNLTWEKKTDDLILCVAFPNSCVNTYYTWSTGGSAPNGTAFTSLLNEMNGGATTSGICGSSDGTHNLVGYAEHCDWRLPTAAELQTILLEPYPCGSNPCIDQSVFGPTQPFGYWSGSSLASNSNGAWVVNPGNGQIFYENSKIYERPVRAVRTGF